MSKIKLGTEGNSSSVYDLIDILDVKGCDGNIVYEIHDHYLTGGAMPNPEFVNRSRLFYETFINSGYVDRWACENISYAAQIDNVWYFASNTGSNTYLGGGPTSTLRIREFCYKNKIKIFYIEDSLDSWIRVLFNKEDFDNGEFPQNKNPIRTEPQSFNEINLIIKRCGDGISRIIDTADKLHEINFRDLFLSAIHSHANYIVEAEATNRKGRTDLKIYDRQLVVPYIYEFKVHRNDSDIKEGLNQITSQYATINNKFNGLVLLNKKQTDLSKILTSIEVLLHNIELDIEDININQNDHTIVVKHQHRLDKTINCILTVFLFDIQMLIGSTNEV